MTALMEKQSKHPFLYTSTHSSFSSPLFSILFSLHFYPFPKTKTDRRLLIRAIYGLYFHPASSISHPYDLFHLHKIVISLSLSIISPVFVPSQDGYVSLCFCKKHANSSGPVVDWFATSSSLGFVFCVWHTWHYDRWRSVFLQ